MMYMYCMAGQGGRQVLCPSESTLVQVCLCLTPVRVCTARTQMCTHVKDPISICCKRVGLTDGGIKTRKHWKKLVKPYKRLQCHGHTHEKWRTVVASLMLVACLVVDRIQH